MKVPLLSYIINSALLCSGFVMAFSGLLIQINYHMGNHGAIDINHMTFGINYWAWSEIHKIVIIIVSIFMIFHMIRHWKWYKIVIKKSLFSKNKLVILLSIVFIITAISGYIPWLISLTGGEEESRKMFIEFHDKIALFLFVLLVLHVSKRLKWFLTYFGKLKSKSSI
jgi:hypothetical protein